MQPIIRDSEDEDDEEFLIPEDHAVTKPSQQSNSSWMVATVDEILAQHTSQGSERADRSSLSTRNLQRQIADAGRGLFDSTSDQVTMEEHASNTSSTPTAKNGRRHSAVTGSTSSAKATVKRTKTGIITYGSSKNTRPRETDNFGAFQEEPLPGTLQTDFANHEPTIMFRDTGSTVADNESSQQRMLEQTINQGKQLSNAADQKLIDSDKLESSPFPWTESSVPTQTPGRIVNKQQLQEQDMVCENVETHTNSRPDIVVRSEASIADQSGTVARDGAGLQEQVHGSNSPDPTGGANSLVSVDAPVSRKQSPPVHLEEAQIVAKGPSQPAKAQEPPNSSPQVSIPRVRLKSNNQASSRTDDVPKGRKRKASTAATQPLNSDDRAIGLPKELYQPRPSRRRATGLVEQPQDFSIIPEKAAKRRRKTAIATSATPEIAEDELATDITTAPQAGAALKSNNLTGSGARTVEPATTNTVQAVEEKPQPGRGEVRALLKDLDFPLTTTSFDAARTEILSPTKDASPLSVKRISAVAKISMAPPSSPAISTSPTKRISNAAAASAMPPPSSSAKRTSRRSHTTIFEDHVEFAGSQQRSPSLRQQQASRKSAALEEVKHISTQGARRKRRTILRDEADDEDGEDELVQDTVAEVPVSKKRGRPAKAAAKKLSPADRVLQDSDAESDDEEIVEPPKKEGRAVKAASAKSVKSAGRVLEDSEGEFDEHEIEDEGPAKKKAGGRASQATAVATKETSASAAAGKTSSRRGSIASNRPATPPSQEQTLPLTKQDAAAKSAAPTKAAPTTHTPIKTTSKIIHRVGLNRKQRVQPLLKMVRPPVARPPPPAKKR